MKTLTVVLATALTSLVGAAQARTPEVEIRQRIVSYADLNLDRQAGIEKLYGRISAAARHVCRTPGVASFALNHVMQECAAQATARAVADVNVLLLTRYHVERSYAYDAGAHVPALVQRDRDERSGN